MEDFFANRIDAQTQDLDSSMSEEMGWTGVAFCGRWLAECL